MDAVIALLAQQGNVSRAEALTRGMTDRQLREEVRAGNLTRFRQGTFANSLHRRSLDAQGRHLLRLRAVMASSGDVVRASHVSSALKNGRDVWGVDLSRVHVTRVDGGAGRHEGDAVTTSARSTTRPTWWWSTGWRSPHRPVPRSRSRSA